MTTSRCCQHLLFPLKVSLFILAALMMLVVPKSEAQTGTLFVENGNVGISEPNPLHPLHIVRSDGTARVVVQETNGTVANRSLFTLINNGGPEFSLLNSNSAQQWRFHTGAGRFNISLNGSGVDEMKVLPGGDVVIAGSLTTAATSYPDYVFEEGYSLMPLADLADYIDSHRHLPNIPTAEETDGGKQIDMSDLQVRLLEKVEELTLYTLQQERRIVEQQAQIEQLRKEMIELAELDGVR
jgi:hypothetical protein